ncbi:hypothetical protein GCM10023116_18990 [Kistimonas scapharcae]|uniref:Uncharacterized protein n=1 Tax=Kistimonas scapharcae TaxID=1036133 RepID=A0ABP8V083_9GAMM
MNVENQASLHQRLIELTSTSFERYIAQYAHQTFLNTNKPMDRKNDDHRV